MNDTSEEVAARYRAMLMARSPEERVTMGARMFEVARALILASLPAELSADEQRRRLFARLYPEIPADRTPPALRSRA